MIYLIDDKRERQQSLGWNSVKFNKNETKISTIYTYAQIDENVRKSIFQIGNIVLFHDSFFDNPINNKKTESLKLKSKLIGYAEKNNFTVVFFSGSIGNRSISDNTATIPVNVLYQNLEFYIKDNSDIKNIVFGENDKNEEYLLLKQSIWELLYDKKNNDKFINEALINNMLMKIPALKNINIDNISNGYLKHLINK